MISVGRDVRVVVEAYQSLQLRCLCPTCLRLDARYPGEGYQLALFEYRRLQRPKRPLTLVAKADAGE